MRTIFTTALMFVLALTAMAQKEAKSIIMTENIAYRTDVGKSTVLDLALPQFGPQQNRPAILIVHGGGWSAGSKNDAVYRALMVDYAMQGYVVANVNYRLVQESPMPACIEDVRCAVRWMKAHARELGIDPERIGTFGHSAGGHLSLMLGVASANTAFDTAGQPWGDYSSSVACSVGGAPPTEIGNPNSPWAQHPEWWPIGYIGKCNTPVLVLQGDVDPIVKPRLTEDWVEKMRRAGADVEYVKAHGDHGVAYDKQLEVTRPAMDQFFARHLKLPTVDESLGRHNFFYAGQSKQRRMFIVKDGQVSWSYQDKLGRGEISDAVLMTDGHILVAHQYGVAEVDGEGQTVWSYAAPEGTEIHTAQPIGSRHVVFVQNGKPAKAVVMEIPACRIVREFELPTHEKGSVHGQFRNARLSSRGTYLVANMALGCIHEFTSDGKEVDRWSGFLPWSVQELPKTGNLLITGRKGLIQEINRQGQTVWQMNTTAFGVTQPQKTVRLKNGNHLVNNWYNEWNKEPMDTVNAPVQAVEVDKDGQVVWQLKAWKDPDLGPSTTIQMLDEAVNRNRLFFGEFNAPSPKLFAKPNEPVGVGRGIHPGRVAWVHSPGMAKWDGKTGLWVEDRWNDQAKADAMIPEAVMQLTGEPTAKKAWQALFRHFNKTHGRGNRGYKKGEMIAVKLNLNNAITHHDTIELNSSPFVTLALVRSMVHDGGVRQQDIVVCEPSRAITDSIYDKIHREFPLVRMIDNIGGDGREKCEYYPEQIVYSADNGKMARGLAKCIVDADYLINSALLKTHNGPGVTLTAKNWYGATDISLLWRQNAHNNISADKRNGKPGYKTFVDFMAHKDLGQKTLLFLIDGTYGSRDVNGAPNPKWMKEPFGGDWACSLIVSQDEVACDAVAMDIIIGEWPEFGSLNYCDEYLREAASLPNAPSGTVYKFGGEPLTQPLGLFEHWNNQKERKYTKIDLKYKQL